MPIPIVLSLIFIYLALVEIGPLANLVVLFCALQATVYNDSPGYAPDTNQGLVCGLSREKLGRIHLIEDDNSAFGACLTVTISTEATKNTKRGSEVYFSRDTKIVIKNAVKRLPYLRGVVQERDELRAELDRLREDNASLAEQVASLEAAAARLGTWMPPGHFYSPITCAEEIKLKEDEIWKKPMPDRVIAGVDLNEAEQLKLWGEFTGYYREQPWTAARQEGLRYFFDNENYSYSDGLFLYYMLRHLRPRRLIEVGSGYSSCVTLDTNELYFDNAIECTFIEPHPDLLFALIKEEDRSRIKVMPERVQDVSLDVFDELEEGDVLFVDSTHVAKTASDVNHLVFDILPRLKSGVHVHFHDIFYPFVYPKEWEYEGRSWNETYLLRAFLQYNNAFRIYIYSGFLQYFHYDEFMKDMPLSMIRNGASIWIKKLHDGD